MLAPVAFLRAPTVSEVVLAVGIALAFALTEALVRRNEDRRAAVLRLLRLAIARMRAAARAHRGTLARLRPLLRSLAPRRGGPAPQPPRARSRAPEEAGGPQHRPPPAPRPRARPSAPAVARAQAVAPTAGRDPVEQQAPGARERTPALRTNGFVVAMVPFERRPALAVAGWATAALFVATLQAGLLTIDPKLGAAFALALVIGALVTHDTALLLPVATLTIFIEGLTLNGMAATRILVPGALLVLLVEVLRGAGRVRPSAPLVCVGGYTAWVILTGQWTVAPEGTRFLLQSLAIALVFMFSFAALMNTERDLRRVLYVLAFVGSITGGISVLAFASMIGSPPGVDLLQAGRAQGFVGDPDFFAAMEMVAVPLVLALATEVRDPRMRAFLYSSVIVLLVAIFTSLSRGAFLALILLGVLLLVSNPERLFRSRREKGFALLVIAIGMAAFFSRPFVRATVVERAQSIYAPKDKDEKSGSGRTNIWKAAARTWKENPIGGVGFGTFPHISQELILNTPGVDLEVQQLRAEGNNFVAHNTYLGIAAETGSIGLALYLSIVFAVGLRLRRLAARAFALDALFVGRVAHALLLGLVAWAACSIFLSTETARMFWVIVGITLALPKLLERYERRSAQELPA